MPEMSMLEDFQSTRHVDDTLLSLSLLPIATYQKPWLNEAHYVNFFESKIYFRSASFGCLGVVGLLLEATHRGARRELLADQINVRNTSFSDLVHHLVVLIEILVLFDDKILSKKVFRLKCRRGCGRRLRTTHDGWRRCLSVVACVVIRDQCDRKRNSCNRRSTWKVTVFPLRVYSELRMTRREEIPVASDICKLSDYFQVFQDKKKLRKIALRWFAF